MKSVTIKLVYEFWEMVMEISFFYYANGTVYQKSEFYIYVMCRNNGTFNIILWSWLFKKVQCTTSNKLQLKLQPEIALEVALRLRPQVGPWSTYSGTRCYSNKSLSLSNGSRNWTNSSFPSLTALCYRVSLCSRSLGSWGFFLWMHALKFSNGWNTLLHTGPIKAFLQKRNLECSKQ